MIEYFLTGIVIPIFIGVAIDKISNKKEKTTNLLAVVVVSHFL
ncbi:hypothetical protein [Peptacetobacter sp.]